jgi:serine/threonine-protein kinase
LPSLAAARPGVPAAVERAVATALAKTPADRFATADRFAEALGRAETDAWSVATPAAPPAKRRIPAWGWGGLALGAVGLTALLVTVPPRRDAAAPPGTGFPRTAIAVLPFQDLSGDREHAYFAGGLHDELLTQLSKVASLRVISRTSVMRYAGGTSPIGEIARALRVGSVVEGTVQVVGGRLRVNVQLIDAASDAHLWADRYDRTLDDAFAIQSDVVQHIVSAVGAALSRAESQGMTESPTANAEAYRLYLQGREYFARPGRLRQDYETAQQLYERAVALDSGFALAHAALADVHGLMHLLRYDASPERLARVVAEAEIASRLAPDLPKAHEALGLAYGRAKGDYVRALQEYQLAVRGLPNDARLWQRIGFSNRVLGNWDEALTAFAKATDLDPYDADLFLHLGITELLTRRYTKAIRTLDEAVRLAPDLHAAAIVKGWAFTRAQGNLDTLRAVLERLPEGLSLGPFGEVAAQWALLHYWERAPDRLLQALQTSQSAVFEWELSFRPVTLYSGWAHQLRGDRVAARAAFDSARAVLDARLVRVPDDWQAVAARGLVLAGLGDRAAALRDAHRLESRVRHAGGYIEAHLLEDRARILAQIGETGAALDQIEQLLQGPSWLSENILRLDPSWDPIRDHPRFRALLARSAPR